MSYSPRPPLGQATMANSEPVVIASDQSAVPVSGTVTVNAANLDVRDLVFATDKVDVSGSSSVGVTGTFWQATQPVSIAQDVMLGTDFSDVFGTASLLTTTQADDIVNTIDTLNVSSFLYAFDGLTWDRLRGTSADGLLVNLGANNDVTVTGTVSATQSGTWVLGANSGVDIGDVTINNAGGGSAVNIQDGGNIITVDGTVSVTGVATEATLTSLLTSSQLIDDSVVTLGTSTYTEATSKALVIGGVRRDADTTLVDTTNEFAPLQLDANGRLKVEVFSGETLPVSLASTTITGTVAVTQSGTWDEVGINDSGNSITVDAPVGTPVNTQIGNGTLQAGIVDESGTSAVDALAVGGGTPHDSVNSGNPILNGSEAIAHGTNPTAVAAADRTKNYANRAGIPFVIGGHPNIQSAEYFTSGAITDDNILPAIATGTKYVITCITVTCSAANATTPSVRIGFGTASVPAQGATNADAVNKVILSHPGIAAGSGIVKGTGAGIVGIGGDGEELRITCTTPTTSLIVQVDYYTIES